MSQKTKIPWCDSSVNPVMGCDGCELWSHAKDGIKVCYAGQITERYGGTNKGYPDTFKQVTEFPGRMAKAVRWKDLTGQARPGEPWLNGQPRHIFISDMGDSLSKAVGFEYLRDEIILMVDSDAGRVHKWLWLTKVPSRMMLFSEWLHAQGIDWPDNLMAMTSITSKITMGRLDHLLNVRCKFRGVSFEPLWGDVGDFRELLSGYFCRRCYRAIPRNRMKIANRMEMEGLCCPHCGVSELDMDNSQPHAYTLISKPGIDWAIVGGQSGSDIIKSMELAWLRNIVQQCQSFRVPLFTKQDSGRVPDQRGQIPDDLWIREFPNWGAPGAKEECDA